MEYWSREEKVDAIQWTANNMHAVALMVDGNVNLLPGFCYASDPDVKAEVRTTRSGWQPVRDGDYVIIDGLGEIVVLSEREFTKRYYRRPL